MPRHIRVAGMIEEEVIRVDAYHIYFSLAGIPEGGRAHVGVVFDAPDYGLDYFGCPVRVGEDVDVELEEDGGGADDVFVVLPGVSDFGKGVGRGVVCGHACD